MGKQMLAALREMSVAPREMLAAPCIMFAKDHRRGLMCLPGGSFSPIHEKTLVSRNDFYRVSSVIYFLVFFDFLRALIGQCLF